MNIDQIVYTISRAADRGEFMLSLGGILLTESFISSYTLPHNIPTLLLSLTSSGFAVFCCFQAVKTINKASNIQACFQLTTNTKEHVLEFADTVVIEDVPGIERLLEKTKTAEQKEWGTLLKAHADEKRAVIDEIADTTEVADYFSDATEFSLKIDAGRAWRTGYNGCHHFHPSAGGFVAQNYVVSDTDRCKPPNWINLLTFNMSEGPELIGFNRFSTYIPKDKSKRVLCRAKPKQIMEYLAKK